jgi:IMP dehydrogenase/GMP reductase
VDYKGRLKPFIKRDLLKLKSAMSNTGCKNLKEFREKAVIELISPHSTVIISNSHNVSKKK